MAFNWNSIKSVILHAVILFLASVSATVGATGWTFSKSAAVSAIITGATVVGHYLAGLLPNGTVSVNRVTAKIRSITGSDQAA